jgi:hypothetical protein
MKTGRWTAHGIRVEVVRRLGNRSTGTLHDPQQSLCPELWRASSRPNAGVVERTHAWNERWHRMVMHHDRRTSVSVAWVGLVEHLKLLDTSSARSAASLLSAPDLPPAGASKTA